MKLTVVWHKPSWRSAASPTGYATLGGLPRQVTALSDLFDATRIVGPCSGPGQQPGEVPIDGRNVRVVPLTWLPRSPWLTWLLLPFWLGWNGRTLMREVSRAESVLTLIPSPIGILGLILALLLRKPLLIRQLNGWTDPALLWRLERRLLECIAGGRNVVFATGASAEPPSRRNQAIRWIFSTTMTAREVVAHGVPRSLASEGCRRLIVAGRELDGPGARIVLEALPLLAGELADITLDVIGHGAALSGLEQLADRLGLTARVRFHGSVTHERVLDLLGRADLFCLLARETEMFRQAVHEAMACGLPVVAARWSLTPRLLDPGCGIVIADPTPSAVAAAITAALSDATQYRTMSLDALRTARPYTLERWRDTIRRSLEAAWGPLRPAPFEGPVC